MPAVVAEGGERDQPLARRADRRDLPVGAVLGADPVLGLAAGRAPRASPPAASDRGSSVFATAVDEDDDGSAQAPVIASASTPARFAAIAKCDDDRASQSRPVSGLNATTANLAEVVSGLPTSGLSAKTRAASGPRGDRYPAGRLVGDDPGVPARPRRRKRRRMLGASGRRTRAAAAGVDPEVAAVVAGRHGDVRKTREDPHPPPRFCEGRASPDVESTPTGTRTPVPWLRTKYPRPLDDGGLGRDSIINQGLVESRLEAGFEVVDRLSMLCVLGLAQS